MEIMHRQKHGDVIYLVERPIAELLAIPVT